jgi:hypothetical protein
MFNYKLINKMDYNITSKIKTKREIIEKHQIAINVIMSENIKWKWKWKYAILKISC